ERGRVLGHDERDLELVEPLGRHREADQAAPVACHEVDRFWRHLLGRNRQIALVLAICIVDNDDHAAGANRLDGVFDAREGRRFLPGDREGPRALGVPDRLALVLLGCALHCWSLILGHRSVLSPSFVLGLYVLSPASSAERTTYLPTMSHS